MGILKRDKSPDERQQEQRQHQQHSLNLQAASQPSSDEMDRAYIDKMTDHSLDQGTINLLSNMLDEDFMLGKLSEAEHNEFRWLARVMRLEVEALHPNKDSVFQGDVRAVAFDDTDQALPALDQKDKAIIEQFIHAAISRASRGKEGWQQEMFNKTITASETRDVSDDDSGGII